MLSQKKTKPIALEAKASLKRAETKLEEGMKALTEWQNIQRWQTGQILGGPL